MKLIDLLVQELPKRGGWPDGAEIAVQDADSQICFSSHGDVYANKCQTDWYGGDWGDGDWSNPFIDTIADDRHECIVSRKQYESALSASQKPAWNGEGVPPVGCECEYSLNAGRTWWKCKIDYIVGTQGVVMLCDTFEGVQYVKFSSYGGTLKFRPISAEADKKRERICDAIYGALTKAERQHNRSDEAEAVYEAIAQQARFPA
ncbi:hypothetical protein IHF37_004575 [Salmonella enterica]|nr:hypothetical protein [Salmonella enterica]